MGATVVVQARMTSRRLPGKVMMEVAGRPLLALLLTRLRHARRVGTIVLATTRLTSDDPLAALAADLDVPLVRGDEDDVLGRFAAAAALAPSPVMVRVTGDARCLTRPSSTPIWRSSAVAGCMTMFGAAIVRPCPMA